MNLPQRRRMLLDRHAFFDGRHRALKSRPGQLLELREHHEELQEHQAALAAFETALQDAPPDERRALSVATALEAAEVMLVEAGRAVDAARQAWRRATEVYQKVRDMLDREE
jgi:tetratricopeptide (TPR) repeat protein